MSYKNGSKPHIGDDVSLTYIEVPDNDTVFGRVVYASAAGTQIAFVVTIPTKRYGLGEVIHYNACFCNRVGGYRLRCDHKSFSHGIPESGIRSKDCVDNGKVS